MAYQDSICSQSPRFDQFDQSCMDESLQLSTSDSGSPKHEEAAIRFQKMYKSFRERRKLGDCPVLIEQNWCKALDSAELKRSSISFFDINKKETAVSRWAQARTRAAKVGKGLSKNCKAQELPLQHCLEVIDPRHRYGNNLHCYYLEWLHSESKEPFFYWLDIGEGKEVNLVEKCPRSKLQQQCIKYLGPMERKAYRVAIEDGKLFYKQTGEFIDTIRQTKGAKWIFVLSPTKTLYVGIKKKGSFQHSSFLAGGATLAAGRIVAENGVIKAVWPRSGHYRPTQENFQDFISFLRENGVDTSYVKMDSNDDDDDKEYFRLQSSNSHVRTNSSKREKERLETEEADLEDCIRERTGKERDSKLVSSKKPRLSVSFARNLNPLEIPKNDDLSVKSKTGIRDFASETVLDGFSDDEHDPEVDEEAVPNKETESFQLGRQLSCKWSTRAGP